MAIGYRADRDAAEAIVNRIAGTGGQAIAVQTDITNESDVARLFDSAEKALGGVECVVANAGIVAPPMPLAEMTVDRLRGVPRLPGEDSTGCVPLQSG